VRAHPLDHLTLARISPGRARALSGVRVLVTGAGRGIGAEVARQLAARGARVAVVGRSMGNITDMAAELNQRHGPGTARAYQADITDLDRLRAAVDDAERDLGGLDVVVANAGVASYGSIANTDVAAFERTVNVNLVGNFNTAHAALPALKRSKGYFLLVASLAAFPPGVGFASYGASKAGTEAMIDSMRYELRRSGVGVGIAHPSWVDTDMVREVDADLPSFHEGRTTLLPFPYNVTCDVDTCARGLVRGIARRKQRIYIPLSVGLVRWNRWILTSTLGWLVAIRRIDTYVTGIERETAGLGRAASRRTSEQTQQPVPVEESPALTR
jgi:NAD(P)-dependent dehydrogenase (short-subunit alcohol dehydrogenase family)